MATKNNLFTLEDTLSFEEYAFLLFHTNLKGYQLVAALNECMEIELERIDMPNKDSSMTRHGMPIYAYFDDMVDVSYYVVDAWYYRNMTVQLSNAINASDKVLVLKGSEAIAVRQKIYNGINSRTKIEDPDDILALQNITSWENLAANIIDVNYYDFSDTNNPRSSQWANTPKPWSANMQRMVSYIQDFFTDLLHIIEEEDKVREIDACVVDNRSI